MHKTIIAGLAALALLFVLVSPVGAQTNTPAPTTDTAALIQQILAQIAALQAQLAVLKEQSGSTPAFCHSWNALLRAGSQGLEVAALHTALNKEGFSVPASETAQQLFDEGTAAAVVGLQQKYRSEILDPIGLQYGTGIAGAATRAKLNALYGCSRVGTPPSNSLYLSQVSPSSGAPGSEVKLIGSGWKAGDALRVAFWETASNGGKAAYSTIYATQAGVLNFTIPYTLTLSSEAGDSQFSTAAGSHKIAISNNYSKSNIVDFTVTGSSATTYPRTSGPSIHISASSNGQTSDSVLNVGAGADVTFSGTPVNLSGSYFTDYTRAWFFGSILEKVCLKTDNGAANTQWYLTCTTAKTGTAQVYVTIYKGGQKYTSNTITLNVVSAAPSITAIPDPNTQYGADGNLGVNWIMNYNSSSVKIHLYNPDLGDVYVSSATNGTIGLNQASIPPNVVKTTGQYKIGVCDDNQSPVGLSGKALCSWGNYLTVTASTITGAPVFTLRGPLGTLVQNTNYLWSALVSNLAPYSQVYLYIQRPDGSMKYNGVYVGNSGPYTQLGYEENRKLENEGQVGRYTVWVGTFLSGKEANNSNKIYVDVVSSQSTFRSPLHCDYLQPDPSTGCTYVPGPTYNASTNCGLVLSCPVSIISVAYPNGGEVLNAGSSYQVRWTLNKDVTDKPVNITLRTQTSDIVMNREIASNVPNTGTWTWNIPIDLTGSNFKIVVSTADGSASDTSETNFTISPPTYRAYLPSILETLNQLLKLLSA